MSTRRSGLFVGVGLLAVMAAGVAVLVDDEDRTTAVPTIIPTGGTSSAALAASGRWTTLPPAPIAYRSSPASAWTGRELLVWGGSSADRVDVPRDDGAGYDPRADRWRLLPAAPIPGRTQASAVWTGHEFIVWGGFDTPTPPHVTGDGAAYDPAANRWRPLPASPLEPRAGAVAVWTGREVIVIGGRSAVPTGGSNEYADAAAYDPVRNSWRRLPPVPVPDGHDLWAPLAVWTGDQLLVWWPWNHTEVLPGGGIRGTYGYDLLRYNPAAEQWDLLPDPDTPPGLGHPVWTGRDVIVAGAQVFRGGFGGPVSPHVPPHRYDPHTNTWTEMRGAPDWLGPTAWTGDGLLLAAGRQLALWTPETAAWRELPAVPATMPALPYTPASAWTGRELLLWGTDFARAAAPGSTDGTVVPEVVGLRFGV